MFLVARCLAVILLLASIVPSTTFAATLIRIMPPDGGVLAAGQRFDIRVEATGDRAEPPASLTVVVNGRDITSRNDPAADRGAPANSRNFLLRNFSVDAAGPLRIEAKTPDGSAATAQLTVEAWALSTPRRAGGSPGARARNIIFLLGDGMGAAHRTAARILSRGVRNGKPTVVWRWIRSMSPEW
jgi:alkaline phosphatase